MKILILKPTSLGDVIHALPVLRLLKAHFPQADISWWIDSTNAELLRGDPDLSTLFLLQRKRWKSPLNWNELFHQIHDLRKQKFDLVIDLQGLARSSLVAWFANGSFTIGVDDRREGAPALYDIAVPRPSVTTHAVDWYLEVLRVLKVPVDVPFQWMRPFADASQTVRSRWNPQNKQWIALCPGARWSNKRWPVAYFKQLATLLSAAYSNHYLVVIGGPDDFSLGEEIASSHSDRCLNLAGKTSLREMVEFLRYSELLITNDTGPMHIAVALDRPVLALFGPTSPLRTGPYGQKANVLQTKSLPCVPCMRSVCHWREPLACLKDLTPHHVLSQVRSILPE